MDSSVCAIIFLVILLLISLWSDYVIGRKCNFTDHVFVYCIRGSGISLVYEVKYTSYVLSYKLLRVDFISLSS